MPLHGIFKAILKGERDRGTGGFLYVKGDSCAYMYPHELCGQDDARDAIAELLSDENTNTNYYIMEERDSKLHILAYPKAHVYRAVEESMAATVDNAEPRIVEEEEEDTDDP